MRWCTMKGRGNKKPPLKNDWHRWLSQMAHTVPCVAFNSCPGSVRTLPESCPEAGRALAGSCPNAVRKFFSGSAACKALPALQGNFVKTRHASFQKKISARRKSAPKDLTTNTDMSKTPDNALVVTRCVNRLATQRGGEQLTTSLKPPQPSVSSNSRLKGRRQRGSNAAAQQRNADSNADL